MTLTKEDISAIVSALEAQIEDICARQVNAAVAEIPFTVRKLVDEEFTHAIRDRVRKALRNELNVDIKVVVP